MQLIQGDCLSILPTLETGSVNAVVTDPQYGMANDTNAKRFTGGMGGHRAGSCGRSFDAGLGRDWGGYIEGDDKPFDPSPWLDFPKVLLFGSNHFACRLPLGTTLVWIKKHEDAFGSFLSDAELAWVKGGYGVYCRKDTSHNRIQANRLHPNQKPVSLLLWCFERLGLKPGDSVLDPYMGSGTTGVACLRAGLNFIGIEIDPVHYATAERRIEAERTRHPLFAGIAGGD